MLQDKLSVYNNSFELICFELQLFQDIESYGSSLFSRVLRAAVLCLGFPEKHFAEVNSRVLRARIEKPVPFCPKS